MKINDFSNFREWAERFKDGHGGYTGMWGSYKSLKRVSDHEGTVEVSIQRDRSVFFKFTITKHEAGKKVFTQLLVSEEFGVTDRLQGERVQDEGGEYPGRVIKQMTVREVKKEYRTIEIQVIEFR